MAAAEPGCPPIRRLHDERFLRAVRRTTAPTTTTASTLKPNANEPVALYSAPSAFAAAPAVPVEQISQETMTVATVNARVASRDNPRSVLSNHSGDRTEATGRADDAGSSRSGARPLETAAAGCDDTTQTNARPIICTM